MDYEKTRALGLILTLKRKERRGHKRSKEAFEGAAFCGLQFIMGGGSLQFKVAEGEGGGGKFESMCGP